VDESISLEKKIDLLFLEWKYLQNSSAWNFDIIEKQRNYGFIFIAAVFGITKASILDQQTQLWLLIPPIVIILLARITTQLEFINVRLNRILDIEHQVSKMCGDSEILTTETRFSTNTHSTSVYVITYLYIYAFFYSVLGFGLYNSFQYLGKSSTWLQWPYVSVFLITIVFLIIRHLSYTLSRYKKKKQVMERVTKSSKETMIEVVK